MYISTLPTRINICRRRRTVVVALLSSYFCRPIYAPLLPPSFPFLLSSSCILSILAVSSQSIVQDAPSCFRRRQPYLVSPFSLSGGSSSSSSLFFLMLFSSYPYVRMYVFLFLLCMLAHLIISLH